MVLAADLDLHAAGDAYQRHCAWIRDDLECQPLLIGAHNAIMLQDKASHPLIKWSADLFNGNLTSWLFGGSHDG